MSVGLALLRRMLEEGTPLSELKRGRLVVDDLVGEERAIADCAADHYKLYGVMPSIDTVQVTTGLCLPEFPDEPLDYWLDLCAKRKVEKALHDGARELTRALREGDVVGARGIVDTLYAGSRTRWDEEEVCTLADMRDVVLEAHDRRRMSVGLSGIATGFPSLDAVSDGAQAGDFWPLIGRPGKGKTLILGHRALSGNAAGAKVMFCSYEMGMLQVARRLFAEAYHFSTNRLRFGLLSTKAAEVLRAEMYGNVLPFDRTRKAMGIDPERIILVKGSFASNVEDLWGLVEKYRPDLLCVDGAYLLKTRARVEGGRGAVVSYTAQELKAIAQAFDIPVDGSYQFNRDAVKARRGAGIEHIYMSDAIGQLGSVILGIEDMDPRQDDPSYIKRKLIRLMKGREGEVGRIEVEINFDAMAVREVTATGIIAPGTEEDGEEEHYATPSVA